MLVQVLEKAGWHPEEEKLHFMFSLALFQKLTTYVKWIFNLQEVTGCQASCY